MQIKFNKSIFPDNHGDFSHERLIERGWTNELIKCYLTSFISIFGLRKTYFYKSVMDAEQLIEERL